MAHRTPAERAAGPAPHPDLLIARGVGWRRMAPILASAMALPLDHVFRNDLPVEAIYERLVDEGYLVVGRFGAGAFEWIAQGMLRAHQLADQALQELSARLDVPVCLDRSESDMRPEYIVYTPLAIHRGISVITREDSRGNIALVSAAVAELRRTEFDARPDDSPELSMAAKTRPDKAG